MTGGLASRATWAIADQMASSVTNFALGVLVARVATPAEFGAFSLVFWTFLVFLTGARAVASQPLIITSSHVERAVWAPAVAQATGSALVLGLAGGALMVVGGILAGPEGGAAIVIGLGLSGLLVQDTLRFALVAAGRAGAALVSDLTWAIVMAALLGVAWLNSVTLDSTGTVATWVLGACAGAVVAVALARVVPSPIRTIPWLLHHRALIPGLVMTNASETILQTVRQYLLAAIAGLGVVGALRAGYLVLSPIMVAYQGIMLIATPEAARVRRANPSRFVRWLVILSLILAAGAASVAIAAIIVPNEWGRLLLQANWDAARPILIPLALATILTVSTTGGGIGLMVLGKTPRLAAVTASTKLLGTVLVLVGGAVAGAVGAAWAMVIEWLLTSGAHWEALRRELRGSALTAPEVSPPQPAPGSRPP